MESHANVLNAYEGGRLAGRRMFQGRDARKEREPSLGVDALRNLLQVDDFIGASAYAGPTPQEGLEQEGDIP